MQKSWIEQTKLVNPNSQVEWWIIKPIGYDKIKEQARKNFEEILQLEENKELKKLIEIITEEFWWQEKMDESFSHINTKISLINAILYEMWYKTNPHKWLVNIFLERWGFKNLDNIKEKFLKAIS